MTDWLKTDKSCPTCRRPYSNVSKQIKKVERMNDPITPNSSAKKTPIAPTRRSLRGHASPMWVFPSLNQSSPVYPRPQPILIHFHLATHFCIYLLIHPFPPIDLYLVTWHHYSYSFLSHPQFNCSFYLISLTYGLLVSSINTSSWMIFLLVYCTV